MSYVKHEFKSGQKLYAAQLNEMDEQIRANEQAIEEKAGADALEALGERVAASEQAISGKADAGDVDTIRKAVDMVGSLRDEIDALHPLAISSFTVTPNLAEKGSTVTSESFQFAVNRLGVALTLEGDAVKGSSATRADALTTDKTYTLRAVLNGAEKTATASIWFVAPVYYGVSSDYALADGTVLALTRVLTTSRARTFTVNAGEGQVILYALPEALGVPVFKVGGFEGGFALVGAFDFTNASGHTERYRLYRSVNTGLGNTTVEVS